MVANSIQRETIRLESLVPELDMVGPSADECGEEEQIARLRQGDTEVFDAMVVREGPRVARLVQRLVAYPADVEDLVQEVFVRAWQNRRKFRGDARLSTWLHSIAINVCRNHMRRKRLWRMFVNQSQPAETQPPDHVNQLGNNDLLRTGLERLSQRDREVIVLHWLEGMEVKTIAELLGARSNAVEVRLHRAKQRLKKVLEELDE